MNFVPSYNIKLNEIKLLSITVDNNISVPKIYYHLEDGCVLRRSAIKSVCIECSECSIIIKNKVLPDKLKLSAATYLCSSCNNKGENNPAFGKKWTEEQKLVRSEMYIGTNNPMYGKSYYDTWVEKHGEEYANILSQEHNAKCSRKGENNGMFGKTVYGVWVDKYGEDVADKKHTIKKEKAKLWLRNNPDHLENMINLSHKRGYHKTSIEITVEEYLKSIGVNYKYNHIVNKIYQFDFLVNQEIIIEVQGDYWHSNPLYYSNTDPTKKKLNDTQNYKLKLDQLKKDYIVENTTNKIIYLWETEIKNKSYIEILKTHGIY